jgi:hypothetical protein
MRFLKAIPSGALKMDAQAVKRLAENFNYTDLMWLLRQIIEPEDARDVSRLAYSGNCHVRMRRLAAACVAAWREYHR